MPHRIKRRQPRSACCRIRCSDGGQCRCNWPRGGDCRAGWRHCPKGAGSAVLDERAVSPRAAQLEAEVSRAALAENRAACAARMGQMIRGGSVSAAKQSGDIAEARASMRCWRLLALRARCISGSTLRSPGASSTWTAFTPTSELRVSRPRLPEPPGKPRFCVGWKKPTARWTDTMLRDGCCHRPKQRMAICRRWRKPQVSASLRVRPVPSRQLVPETKSSSPARCCLKHGRLHGAPGWTAIWRLVGAGTERGGRGRRAARLVCHQIGSG